MGSHILCAVLPCEGLPADVYSGGASAMGICPHNSEQPVPLPGYMLNGAFGNFANSPDSLPVRQ